MSKTLVAYFSASGTTENTAKKIAKVCGADIYQITPETPYTSADLNWMDKKSRSSVEMSNQNSRPAITGSPENIEEYDTILLGFPIWWYIAPTIINTFLESCDFSHKKIVLFATSGGSGFGKTAEMLKASVSPDTSITEGRVFRGNPSEKELKQWLDSIL